MLRGLCVCILFSLPPIFLNKEKRLQSGQANFFSDIGIQQRMTSSGHSKIFMLCPKSGGGKACAVEPSCSMDTNLCPQEIICQALCFCLFVCLFGGLVVFFPAIGDNVKCDTAIVHNLM